MKLSATSIMLFGAAMLLAGCRDTIDSKRIPYAPVQLSLAGTGVWDLYGVHGFGQGRNFIRTGRRSDQQPPDFPYPDMSATGFGGLLLVADLDNLPLVYDLACPVERRNDVRVVYNRDTQLATCPKCGSTYNVCELQGAPLSGEALQRKWGLQRYAARPATAGGYILSN